MGCSLLVSSVHGILQARILEWVAISHSRGSFQPRDRTRVSCIGRRVLYRCTTQEASSKKLAPVAASWHWMILVAKVLAPHQLKSSCRDCRTASQRQWKGFLCWERKVCRVQCWLSDSTIAEDQKLAELPKDQWHQAPPSIAEVAGGAPEGGSSPLPAGACRVLWGCSIGVAQPRVALVWKSCKRVCMTNLHLEIKHSSRLRQPLVLVPTI